MARTKKTTTQVASIRHKDKRATIPTEELRDFVADEELAPKTILYLCTIKCVSVPRSIP